MEIFCTIDRGGLYQIPGLPQGARSTISGVKLKQLNWIAVAGPLITLAFSPSLTYEPFDNIKLALLGICAGVGFSKFIAVLNKGHAKNLRSLIYVVSLFLIALFIPLLLSGAPFSQQIYGVAGRSLGLLHYLFLASVFLGAATEARDKVLDGFFKALTVTGLIESFYGLLQYFKLDPINWENQDNWLFGTFGNPNFLSAFIGISVSASLFLVFQKNSSKWRSINLANIFLGVAVAALSDSIQGIVLIAVSLSILILVKIFIKSRLLGTLASLGLASAFTMSILGILQIGPLTKFLYQESTTYRGDYWRAGLKMAREHLISGVGLDSYGDHYRQYRDAAAGQRRGLDLYSDTAHNLLIDLAATGGLFLLISYIAINVLVIRSIIKTYKVTNAVSTEAFALPIIWFTFQVQTLISINVSSLAIWGWLAAGLLISGSNQPIDVVQSNMANKGRVTKSKQTINIRAISLASVFLIMVLPLLSRDVQIGSAVKSTNATDLENAVTSWPRSCYFMAKAEEAYTDAGANDISLEISIKSVADNPRCFNSWRHIAENPKASVEQKNLALAQMFGLDPLLN
jgi:O-antigen ligase